MAGARCRTFVQLSIILSACFFGVTGCNDPRPDFVPGERLVFDLAKNPISIQTEEVMNKSTQERVRWLQIGENKLVERSLVLAPPAPISIEGLRLNDPDFQKWFDLNARGWSLDKIKSHFKKETKRDLNAWYEVSGRIVSSKLEINGRLKGNLSTDYQRLSAGGWKVHHRGNTLEFADVVSSHSEAPLKDSTLISFRCGCYGFSEFSPLIRISDFAYSLKLEPVGGYFELLSSEMRKPAQYLILDPNGAEVFRIRFTYGPEYEEQEYSYLFNGRRIVLAKARVLGSRVEVILRRDQESDLEYLDLLFAAIPTQILRGDGVRDTKLASVELAVDYFRSLKQPSVEIYSDVLSDVDVVTATEKILKFLSSNGSRFRVSGEVQAPITICVEKGQCRVLPIRN